MTKLRWWRKPEESTLTAREFSEQMYLVQHHLDECKRLRHEASLARGKNWYPSEETANEIESLEHLANDHLKLAHEANDKIGCVIVRFTGSIVKSEERWSEGTPGLIGSSRPYTHEWSVDVYSSLQEVWFTIEEDRFFHSSRMVGHMEYNGGAATFDPKDNVDIFFVGQQ